MSIAKNFPSANAEYVEEFNKRGLGSLSLPPTKKLIVVTCMDARIDPATSLGFREGEVHVIRNAGGLAKDAIRSIIISQQTGTREIAVFHHTGCGMLAFTTEKLQSKLKAQYPEHEKEISSIDFMGFSDVESSVKSDVEYLKQYPLLADETKITGWVYEVETGKVRQIV